MKKFNFIIFVLTVMFFMVFSSCDDSGGNDDITFAISLGSTLDLSGTITRYFSSPTATWGAGADTAADPYDLINTTGGTNDMAELVSDSDGTDTDDSFTFTAGTPPLTDIVAVEDLGFISSVSDVKIYKAEIQDNNDDQIAEFELSGGYAYWYAYIYVSADTVISGEVTDSGDTYKFDNVSVLQGWNKVISKTNDGILFTYTGGTISGPLWTFMKD